MFTRCRNATCKKTHKIAVMPLSMGSSRNLTLAQSTDAISSYYGLQQRLTWRSMTLRPLTFTPSFGTESDVNRKVPPCVAFSFASVDRHRPDIEVSGLRQSRLPPPVARASVAAIGCHITLHFVSNDKSIQFPSRQYTQTIRSSVGTCPAPQRAASSTLPLIGP